MKKFISIILVLGFFFSTDYATCQNSTTDISSITTFILVRHAEKADKSSNTNLSEAVKNRAQALSNLLA